MNHDDPIPPQGCPRCDYDLAGIGPGAAAPAEERGRCPECGLEFLWADVLERVPPPAWSLEPDHRLRWLRALDRAGRVVLRVLMPARLWQPPDSDWRPAPRGLMLAHPVGAVGLLATACLGFALAWLAAAVTGGSVGMLLHGLEVIEDDAINGATSGAAPSSGLVSVWNSWERIRLSVLAPGVPWSPSSDAAVFSMLLTSCLLMTAVLMPASMLLLGDTLRRSRVRRRHLWRLAAYAIVQLPLLGLLAALPGALAVLMRSLDSCLHSVRLAGNAGGPRYAWAADHAGSKVLALLERADPRACAGALERFGPPIAAGLAVLWLWSYWRRAGSMYLRLPRASVDAGLLLLTALMASATALAVVGVAASRALNYRYY